MPILVFSAHYFWHWSTPDWIVCQLVAAGGGWTPAHDTIRDLMLAGF